MEEKLPRKVAILVRILLILICIAGFYSVAAADDEPIMVYYAGDSKLYRSFLSGYAEEENLKVVSFESSAQMEAQLQIELMSGGGPDVLLLDQTAGLDIRRLAKTGILLDLSSYVEADADIKNGVYFDSVLMGCSFEGFQAALPFSFSLTYMMMAEDTAAEIFADGIADRSLREISSLLRDRAEAIRMQDRALMALMARRSDITCMFSQIGGITVDDQLSESDFLPIADLIHTFYQSIPSLQSISSRYRNDFVNAAGHIDIMLEDYQLPTNLRYYSAYYSLGLQTEMTVLPLPLLDQPGQYSAQVMQYGVINARTTQPDRAWKLIRTLMDADIADSYIRNNLSEATEIPVRRAYAEKIVDSAQKSTGGKAMISGRRMTIPALDTEYAEMIQSWLSSVQSAYIPNSVIGEIMETCMQPYYQDESDFETCFSQLKNRLWLYQNE